MIKQTTRVMMTQREKVEMDLRFQSFLAEIMKISFMQPREKYIYPIMKGVPFCDLETALMMAEMEYANATNDNGEAGL